VVRRAVGSKGEVLMQNQPHVVRRVISEKTATLLSSMLQDVTTEGGTGTMANIEGFTVAGKTGTAQKADPVHGGYAAKKRVASFIGFVPANKPRLVALVLIDEPEVNVYGGVVAAPVFRNVARGALRYFAVAPQKPTALPAAPLRPEAPRRHVVKRPNLKQVEESAEAAPDFVGLSLREALEKAQALKVKVRLQGSGYVIKQSPAPGGRWSEEAGLVLSLQG
jgi:cell division protein FtsI (penicillin-binding protein 3)